MQPIASLSSNTVSKIKIVLTDIDDTLTTHGRLKSETYSVLESLSKAGFIVVPVTGRPAGWCDHIARIWPIDAIVGENGAFYFQYNHNSRVFKKHFCLPLEKRIDNNVRLNQICDQILKNVPGAALASDQSYRETDLAIDYCEDVKRLPQNAVTKIVKYFEDAGANAKVSSIHVNGWFGQYDKLSMTCFLMKECFGINIHEKYDNAIFVGDSPNDSPMFEFFPISVGVANINDFKDDLTSKPTYVTNAREGEGFNEVAKILLEKK